MVVARMGVRGKGRQSLVPASTRSNSERHQRSVRPMTAVSFSRTLNHR
jgi:hypothetical protein